MICHLADPKKAPPLGVVANNGKDSQMPTFSANDGTAIYYKDWGSGNPIVFSHGWPLNGDAWDAQMLFFGQKGYRVVAHDRRGHGRSEQTWDRNDYDTWADDLAALIELLDLTSITLVAHSMGGGEIARYVGRHGTSCSSPRWSSSERCHHSCSKPTTTRAVCHCRSLTVFVPALIENRPEFYRDTSVGFFSYNRPGAKVSQAVEEQFGALECNRVSRHPMTASNDFE